MNYCDFHCDALTQTKDKQITRQSLTEGGCLLQCFAAFVSAREERFQAVNKLIDGFYALCEAEHYNPITAYEQIDPSKINALLTVEEGGALEGDIKNIDNLYERGVRMLGLTWNYPNEIGFPNFPDYEGLISGKTPFSAREGRGLTPFGYEVVRKMQETGMIVDAAHASDGVFFDIAAESARSHTPFCVSHTGADAVLSCARNLTNAQIRTLASVGGVAGLYFCADFLSHDCSREGQRAAMLAHARTFLNEGGEDILVLGSDFDGIPPNAFLPSPAALPALYDDFVRAFGSRIADKIFYKNALEFFKRML